VVAVSFPHRQRSILRGQAGGALFPSELLTPVSRSHHQPEQHTGDDAADPPAGNVASIRSEHTHKDTERHPVEQHPDQPQVEDFVPVHFRSMRPQN